jgi:hypothetical protein
MEESLKIIKEESKSIENTEAHIDIETVKSIEESQ